MESIGHFSWIAIFAGRFMPDIQKIDLPSASGG